MPVRLHALDRWRRSVPIQGTPWARRTVDDCLSTSAPLRPHRAPTASALAVSFQTPELDLQVAIGQLFSQETEQRTEQPGLFQ